MRYDEGRADEQVMKRNLEEERRVVYFSIGSWLPIFVVGNWMFGFRVCFGRLGVGSRFARRIELSFGKSGVFLGRGVGFVYLARIFHEGRQAVIYYHVASSITMSESPSPTPSFS
jgi:hypothetical protein